MQKILGKKQARKAFTLIELLVVVAIIGILAAVGVVAYNGYTNSAKAAVTKSNHKIVVKEVKLIITNCEIGGSVQLMSTLNSKNYSTDACYGNVQAFFPEYLEALVRLKKLNLKKSKKNNQL